MVGRGAQMTIDGMFKIYALAAACYFPFAGNTFGKVYDGNNPIGTLASTKGVPLVLTAVANTPAASSPATLTAAKAIISPDQNLQMVFNSTLREVPLRWDILLQDVTAVGSLVVLT
jgi:hypothetical protein